MTINPGSAYWEIRSGMSNGNGGSLIASGTGADIVTPTGRGGFGYTEYQNLVSGLNINLAPGQYWFTVVPVAPNDGGRSFNSNTFGLNGIGSYTPNDEFWDSAFFGCSYCDPNSQGAFPAFSGGVIGTIVSSPEPSSLLLLGSGLLGLAGLVRRRVSR
ncbi:MAG: PEP-CTERM sorting domain-containing protein [Terriglobales bacterium]